MKMYWLIAVLLIASCAPAKTPTTMPTGAKKSSLMPRPVATLTQVQPTPVATLTKPPAAPTAEVSVEWKALAVQLRTKAQQAKIGDYWEDIQFKEEAYQICDDMIAISSGQQRLVSKELLKRWRWGIEFMNQGELDEVIRLIDQSN